MSFFYYRRGALHREEQKHRAEGGNTGVDQQHLPHAERVDQQAVFNPALGYLTQSDTYAECGSDLVQILDDARTQYICGQIDEAGLQAAFDQWNARGGTQVIEEVNALYAADKA